MAWNLKNRFIELCKAMKLKKLFLHMLYFLGRIPVRIFQRTPTNGWNEQAYADPVDLDLPSLGIAIPHNEIFARD